MTWRKYIDDVLDDDRHLVRLEELDAGARDGIIARERAKVEATEDKPVISMSRWIENEYFSGSLARILYPKLKEHLIKIVDGSIHRVYLAGATRWGKSVAAETLVGRSLYEISRLASPQRTFHIQDESNIMYLVMNITDKKSKDAFFTRLSAWVKSTDYYRREFPPADRVINQLRFPKHVICNYSGAKRSAAESEDLHFFVGDEANLYERVEKSKRSHAGDVYDAAEEIETEVINRMVGTYRKTDGTYPSSCKQIWLCKETYPKSFMRVRIAEAVSTGAVDRKESYVIESSEWGMKPKRCVQCEEIVPEDAWECSKCGTRVKPIKYFWIRTASRTESAKIVTDEDEKEKQEKTVREMADRGAPEDERFEVKPVPWRYLDQAYKDMEKFQRDMLGIPTEAISVFFRSKEDIFKAVREPGNPVPWHENRKEKATIPAQVCSHPFTSLTTNFEDGVSVIKDALTVSVSTSETDANGNQIYSRRPIINPSVPRCVGIDAGLSGDACGIALGHCCGWRQVLRYDEENVPVEEAAPLIWVDLVLRITPPLGGAIPYRGIIGFVRALSKMGFGISKITCDSFQHVALTQPFSDKGYDVEVVSVDRTPDAYNYLHKAYSEGRMSLYRYTLLEDELTGLERVITKGSASGKLKEKIDHPANNSKDIADALAQMTQQVEMAAGKVSAHSMQLSVVERKETKSMIDRHKAANTVARAFEDGNFEDMQRMLDRNDDW